MVLLLLFWGLFVLFCLFSKTLGSLDCPETHSVDLELTEVCLPLPPECTTAVRLDEGILRFREIAMLEWVHCVKSNPPQGEDAEDTPFTNPMRHKMLRGRQHT